jgi:chemotaxis signal transduction protein
MSLETVLTFVVGADTRLAVESRWVTEVADAGPITPLPRAPEHVKGIGQVRGRPIVVVDLGRFLDLPEHPAGGHGEALRFVMVRTHTMEVALACRSVLFEEVEPQHGSARMAYGDRLRPHVRAEATTRRGPAVVLDLLGVLEAARVRG